MVTLSSNLEAWALGIIRITLASHVQELEVREAGYSDVCWALLKTWWDLNSQVQKILDGYEMGYR